MMVLLKALALLLIGFSVINTGLLALFAFRQQNKVVAYLSVVLLALLASIQLLNFVYLEFAYPWVHSWFYNVLLFMVAPTFYLLSAPLLEAQTGLLSKRWIHFLPVLLALILPPAWALPLAFVVGAGYLLRLALNIYALRAQRSRFRLELLGLALIAVLAVLIILLGVSNSFVPDPVFFSLYASAIGGGFVLVSAVLSLAPQLPTEVAEAARETYAVSTLGKVDCDVVLQQLNQLMQSSKRYQDAELDLPNLSEALGLTHYQVSELINTRLGKSFSRYLREQRVEAAKAQLLDEPKATVLGIGLAVGFSSQSNFYEAFREIVGMTPGQFRKLNQKSAPE